MSIIIGKANPVEVGSDEVSQLGIMARFRSDKAKAQKEAEQKELELKRKNNAKKPAVKTEKKEANSAIFAASEPVEAKSTIKEEKPRQTASDEAKTASKGTSYIIDGSQIVRSTMKRGGRSKKDAKGKEG